MPDLRRVSIVLALSLGLVVGWRPQPVERVKLQGHALRLPAPVVPGNTRRQARSTAALVPPASAETLTGLVSWLRAVWTAPTTTTTTTAPPRPAPTPIAQHYPASYQPCGGEYPPCWRVQTESRGDYSAFNPTGCSYRGRSGCYGKWQFGWFWGGKLGLPLDLAQATPAQQDEAARLLWNGGAGCGNWDACRG